LRNKGKSVQGSEEKHGPCWMLTLLGEKENGGNPWLGEKSVGSGGEIVSGAEKPQGVALKGAGGEEGGNS